MFLCFLMSYFLLWKHKRTKLYKYDAFLTGKLLLALPCVAVALLESDIFHYLDRVSAL